MKRVISIITILSMLCALIALPVSAADYANPFGNEFNAIKPFSRGALEQTKIGTSGYKISTSAGVGSYNNVVVMDYSTKATRKTEKDKYYPLGNGLAENGYYLFVGYGSAGSMTATLTLPQTVAADKYIKITYAKPKATNDGSTERSKDNNDNKLTVGTEVIDLKTNCEFDKWYTTTVKAGETVENLTMTLGQWSAIAISNIEVLDSADTYMELSAADNKTEMFLTGSAQTLKYTATVYKSFTTLMDGTGDKVKGSVDADAVVTYSIDPAYNGVTIDTNGLLTIDSEAEAGKVTVKAMSHAAVKTAELTLSPAGSAEKVVITGSPLAEKNSSVTLSAIPMMNDGTIFPARDTVWSIEGDSKGCSITNGTLTTGEQSGNITVKAVLTATGLQQTAVENTFVVTIKDEAAVSPYTFSGALFDKCAQTLAEATGLNEVIIKAKNADNGYSLVARAVNANGIVTDSKTVALTNIPDGIQAVNTNISLSGAVKAQAYIINSKDEIVTDIYEPTTGEYKNIPLVSDWVTGEKSGLGMAKGILTPTGAPYGVDPSVVDITDLNVSYTDDANAPKPTKDNVLWYKTGAYLKSGKQGNNSIYARDESDWEQKALPIGNGHMAAMLFGLPDKDHVQINEETFWAAGYRGFQTQKTPSDVNGEMSEGINGYMSVGDVFVDFDMPKNAQIKNYYRDLDLDDAVAHVQYEYNGATYKREYFASHPKGVIAFRYTAEKGTLDFDVKPVSMHPGEATVNNGEITIAGKLKDSEPYDKGGAAAWNQESDLEYCTKIKVIAKDGTVTDGYNRVNVSGATEVEIIVAAATDYDKDQFEIKEDGTVNMEKTPYKSETDGIEITRAEKRMNDAAAMTYEKLKAEHIEDYHEQYGTVKFSLTDDDEICEIPTDVLQSSYKSVVSADNTTKNVTYGKTAYNNLNKHLEELHYNYARYMMISSSRSDTMPANLQGKWCQSTAEIWGSCYCININMEMNYWFAGGANLADSAKSLIYWFKSQIPAGTVTAKYQYQVTPKSYKLVGNEIQFSGENVDKEADDVFIMHTKQAINGTTDNTNGNVQSPGNTAWLMYNLWDIYQTTGDKALLRDEIYPVMRKAANFYTQYLATKERKTTTDTEKYPDGYYYTTWEGRSPEQGTKDEGIKYDLQLVAGMYDYTIAAATTLGVDSDKIAAWQEIRNHLELPVELGADGEIKEWKQEVSYNTGADGKAIGDAKHRHISHLVGLYPGTLINRSNPDYLNGARIVLENRGDDSTGWSCSNKFLLWARTLNGDKALELFRYQLAQKTYSNLFDAHTDPDVFQIDGNFGSAAGVMELLMQSQPLNQEQMNTQTAPIYILPALPEVWDKGEISGIKAKNGAEVSIKWEENKATEIKIKPAHDGNLTIGYDKGNIKSLNGRTIEFTEDKFTIKNAEAGQVYVFSTEAGAETEREITLLTASHITATGGNSDTLMVAGYDEHDALVRFEIIEGLDSDITGYDSCKTIKAFLWEGLDSIRPYDSRTFTVTQ